MNDRIFNLITGEIIKNLEEIATANSDDAFELGKRLAYLEVLSIIKRKLLFAGIDEAIYGLDFDEDDKYA